ncbi:DNA mismatch repair endonuclease MutL [Salirhabdus salicampi]|uniref:DNA mismatch repair endonuclease MutL n=1 Tax=Salirhabdus salicampi TaxID=476102 RepID=UPI0020C59D35|nr:DNA mismatch repair endonuclease MutL [Salirhabdus salicampi]MCP8616440.1 DNA mismatch repair endonuclease MutL [Salirhabdus salicampi]
MGKIQLMDEHLANKIAAGEVVERPASVVKELVENSIDANSKWIKVELQEAGLSVIKITDDGDGMSADDCERAFFRHATSKIKTEEDLFRVRSLGFRGEALASIASVSRLKLRTSTGQSAGTMITLHGGEVQKKDKSDARKGTEIVVEDLFYNTPARLKYMKTIHTELGHITDVLYRMALSHPNIRFECIHNDRKLFQTNGNGNLQQVIAQIYGVNTARQMLPVHNETLDFTIQGFVAKPEVTRSNRNYMSTIINGRFIKSHIINKAILQAFHTLLPIGRYPVTVVNIEMDPVLVDVNVHPAKLEVRFSKEKELFDAIEQGVKQTLKKEILIPAGTATRKQKEEAYQSSMTFSNSTVRHQPDRSFYEVQTRDVPDVKEKQSFVLDDVEKQHHGHSRNIEEQPNVPALTDEPMSEQFVEEENGFTQNKQPRIPDLYPIGQLHGTYILAQNEDGLYIIDQHAAQERIKYEFFREKVGYVEEELQELLVPLTFEFSKQEAILVEQYMDELRKVGLFFEPFGDNTFIIRSHPQWLPKGEEEGLIRDMVEQVLEYQKIDLKKLREEAAILMACKRSIKANHYLKHEDMVQLLDDLRTCFDPFTCPHGRPIIVSFSQYELEKMFKRVM